MTEDEMIDVITDSMVVGLGGLQALLSRGHSLGGTATSPLHKQLCLWRGMGVTR